MASGVSANEKSVSFEINRSPDANITQGFY